jgi:hypothetical protein
MKKGKTSKIQGFKTTKVMYGTTDSFELKSIYLNLQTWVEPKEELENWERIVLNLSRQIKHTIFNNINTKTFKNNFIVDLDLRASGLTPNKKSFLNLEINLFLEEKDLDFKSNYLRDNLKDLSKKIIVLNFNSNSYFTFSLTKKGIIDEII